MQRINRRAVLGATSLFWLKECVNAQDAAAIGQQIVWLEESGAIHGKEAFVIAAIWIRDPSLLLPRMQKIFDKNHFRIGMDYRSTNKFKYSPVIELIQLMTADSSMKFYADILLRAANKQWPTDPLASGETLARLYERILRRIPRRDVPAIVFHKSRQARNRHIDAAIQVAFSPIPEIRQSDNDSRVVEFLNVLTGSLHRQFTGNAAVNNTKHNIASYLMEVVTRSTTQSRSNLRVTTFDKLVF
jgi:hypothetical protein